MFDQIVHFLSVDSVRDAYGHNGQCPSSSYITDKLNGMSMTNHACLGTNRSHTTTKVQTNNNNICIAK